MNFIALRSKRLLLSRFSNRLIKHIVLVLLTWCCEKKIAQNLTIDFDSKLHDYGTLDQAYYLTSQFIIKNNSNTKVYIMRADVSSQLKVRINKKTLLPGDTSAITVYYYPSQPGSFSEDIKVVSSAEALPAVLTIKGKIKTILQDEKTACYSFSQGKRKTGNALVIPASAHSTSPEQTPEPPPIPAITIPLPPARKDSLPENPTITATEAHSVTLSKLEYKPNNIVFLIDVSGSMADSMKLPLMKKAIYRLIESLRETDKVSIVTYADSVSLVCEGVQGSDRQQLHRIIERVHAKGLTRGAKAILFSLDVALMQYIPDGNNQIFLASDGKFPFYDGHYKEWTTRQGDKKIIMSTIALGNDKKAIRNLKEIAEKGKGSCIKIKSSADADEKVLEEVKQRSKY